MRFSHLDETGAARMVDVTDKPTTAREAVAAGQVTMQPATLALIQSGGAAKGDVIAVARIAGIMAAKRAPEWIPLCHPLPITSAQVDFAFDEACSTVNITARVRCTGTTGVEMEALTAVSASALTIYDMCKAIDRGMQIHNIRLIRKSGGKSGEIVLEEIE
ncbi:MAG: cyclic pyranopterin monophosphate synthase MoaC [Anaerolineae bacterium]|nr:cyclic pyranopterin monophosphate synthase MoaC [Anaerolineae bacterium]